MVGSPRDRVGLDALEPAGYRVGAPRGVVWEADG
jgi:hypothetical protein